MKLEDSILIHRSTKELYRLLSDIEGHAALLPGYNESRIVERRPGSCVVQRDAMIHGRRRRWKSEVWFERDRAIHFRQVEGPLKGMHVLWALEPLGNRTLMRIIHNVHVMPRWKGWWLERFIAKPAIEKTARTVLEAIKVTAERTTLS
jgi:ribosome-associated toxin RatA of RatAB toxin-antitoxin module